MAAPINASQIKFTGAPNMLPPGAQWFVLSGDPTKAGPFTVRLRLPAGYQIPAHSHPTTEAITVCPASCCSAWATSSTRRRAPC